MIINDLNDRGDIFLGRQYSGDVMTNIGKFSRILHFEIFFMFMTYIDDIELNQVVQLVFKLHNSV